MDINAAFKISATASGQQQVEALAKAVRGVGTSAQVSAGQTSNAMRQLPMQFNDIAVSIAGGQNPFLVLLQQGSQISDSFGGMGNAARALSTVFTPLRLAIGGTALAIGTLAVAAVQGANEVSALNKSLALTGGYAGQTVGQLRAMALAIKEATGTSVGDAKDLTAGAVGSAAFGPQSIQPVVEAMARVQKLSGETSENVVKDFATMSGGVAKWAAEHNKQYNFLTADQFKYIQTLEKSGQTEAAMAETAKLLSDALAKRKVEVGYLETAWNSLGNAASWAWDKMMGLGRPDTMQDKLSSLQSALAQAQAGLARVQQYGQNSWAVKQRQAEITLLQTQINETKNLMARDEEAAAAKAAAAAKEQAAIKELQKTQTDASRIAAAEFALELQRLQNGSQARLNQFTLEEAQLDGLRAAGLISEREYSQQKVALQRKELDERAALIAAEIELEKTRPGNDPAEHAARMKRILELQNQLGQVRAQSQAAGIKAGYEASGGGSEYQGAVQGLQRDLASLNFQLANIQKYGETVATAKAAVMEFEITSGKFKDQTQQQKDKLMELAVAADVAAQALRQQQAGIEFDKRTKAIEAETAALGKNAQERDIILAKQELENKGIREGTELYEQLMQRRTAAIQAAAQAASTWQVGLQQGVNEYLANAGNMAVQTKELVTQAFTHMEDALVTFATTGKLNFRDFANAVIADIIRMQARMAISGMASAFGGAGGIASVIGSFFGPSTIGSAKGNAFDGGQRVTAFARGGAFTNTVATQPTIAPMALFGEAGPEAIMPLARDSSGRLGVRAQGGSNSGGDTITVQVVVNMAEGTTQTSTSGTGDAEAAKQIGNTVAALVKKQLVEEMRNPGGLLYAGRRS